MKDKWLLVRPDITRADAAAIALDRYAVDGTSTELGSQQDRNFRIDGGDSTIVLKITHSSVDRDVIDFQHAVSDALSAADIRTPAILEASAGERVIEVQDRRGERSWACAYGFVPGAQATDDEAFSGADSEEFGRLAGRVAGALSSMEHPAAERPLQWELGQALGVVEALHEHLPRERQSLILQAAHAAAAAIDLLAPNLPRQVIHGDLTVDNVLRTESGDLYVIDLGDSSMSWRVAELAVLAADILGRSTSMATIGRAVRGFTATSPLNDDEFAAIWPLVLLRGAVLAVSGWSQIAIDPGNAYARERLEHEWTVFERAAALDYTDVEAQLRLAAGLPHRRDVGYAPLVSALRSATVVDLGITSVALDRGVWLQGDAEQNLASVACEQAGAAVFRFGETRLTRVSHQVGHHADARSRCVEVWTEPEARVYAPFSGHLRVREGSMEISDRGVVLRVDGASLVRAPGFVDVGELIGSVKPEGRIIVTRRIFDAAEAPLFGGADDEYEVDGAADPSTILGTARAEDPLLELRRSRVRRDRAMGTAAERYYENPPQIERGWGTRLVDTQGRSYLDMVNNVTAIGHSHPRLGDSVSRQLHLLNTNSRFLYNAYADFTEKLLACMPDPRLDTVIPVNSGSEALDLAIRLARVATGRNDVVAVREGYHGWTMAADAVSTSAFDNPTALASRPEWVHLTDIPNPYRGTHRGPDAADRYIDELQAVIDRLVEDGHAPAAFLCEPVLGNAGGVVPPDGYLARAYEAIRAAGGIAIADEVQVGYGRLGDAFWGSELQGAVPDIIAVAKAAGNAFPVGAVITTRAIVESLRDEGMFFSSAGGAPASAMAGAAVLDVIREERLQENAAQVGAHLRRRLEELTSRHPLMGAIHGRGLYLGIELVRDRATLEPAVAETRWICERLLALGVIMQATSERQNVLKVKPPLTLTCDEADAFVDALDHALRELTHRS